jgi:hypothetical protein
MATSTPNPDAPGAAASPTPRRETLRTISAQIAALDEMIGLARHSIRVFDIDLSGMGWNGVERAATIAAFLRGRRNATLQIIVHDTRWIESSCPRVTQLLRQYAHAVTICRTGPDASAVMDPMSIVDDRHLLHRFHIEHANAEFAVEQPLVTRPFVERFEEIWATREPGINATLLGL